MGEEMNALAKEMLAVIVDRFKDEDLFFGGCSIKQFTTEQLLAFCMCQHYAMNNMIVMMSAIDKLDNTMDEKSQASVH